VFFWVTDMQTHQDNAKPSSERPSFFSVPEGMRNWAHVGPRFWAGVLVGISLGLFAGKALVELELLRTQGNVWIMGPVLVFLWLGMMLAMRAVRRSRQSETAKSHSA
jgi:F0F1-type ATP synthase assembly protein I